MDKAEKEFELLEQRISELFKDDKVLYRFRLCSSLAQQGDSDEFRQMYNKLEEEIKDNIEGHFFTKFSQRLPYENLWLDMQIMLKRICSMKGAIAMHDEKQVFIVHGHNVEMKDALKVFLLETGFKPIVLSEQVLAGETIIEKFEKYADRSGVAAILISADDEGYRAGHDEERRYRARQNVILELGYFFARFGRSKTLIIKQSGCDIELPSDIQGCVFCDFDSEGAWQIKAAQAFSYMGYPVRLEDIHIR